MSTTAAAAAALAAVEGDETAAPVRSHSHSHHRHHHHHHHLHSHQPPSQQQQQHHHHQQEHQQEQQQQQQQALPPASAPPPRSRAAIEAHITNITTALFSVPPSHPAAVAHLLTRSSLYLALHGATPPASADPPRAHYATAALRDARNLVRAAPHLPAAWLSLFSASRAASRHRDAALVLTEALRFCPHDPLVRLVADYHHQHPATPPSAVPPLATPSNAALQPPSSPPPLRASMSPSPPPPPPPPAPVAPPQLSSPPPLSPPPPPSQTPLSPTATTAPPPPPPAGKQPELQQQYPKPQLHTQPKPNHLPQSPPPPPLALQPSRHSLTSHSVQKSPPSSPPPPPQQQHGHGDHVIRRRHQQKTLPAPNPQLHNQQQLQSLQLRRSHPTLPLRNNPPLFKSASAATIGMTAADNSEDDVAPVATPAVSMPGLAPRAPDVVSSPPKRRYLAPMQRTYPRLPPRQPRLNPPLNSKAPDVGPAPFGPVQNPGLPSDDDLQDSPSPGATFGNAVPTAATSLDGLDTRRFESLQYQQQSTTSDSSSSSSATAAATSAAAAAAAASTSYPHYKETVSALQAADDALLLGAHDDAILTYTDVLTPRPHAPPMPTALAARALASRSDAALRKAVYDHDPSALRSALADARHLTVLTPRIPTAWTKLADVHVQNNAPLRARRALVKGLRACSGSPLLLDALAEVDQTIRGTEGRAAPSNGEKPAKLRQTVVQEPGASRVKTTSGTIPGSVAGSSEHRHATESFSALTPQGGVPHASQLAERDDTSTQAVRGSRSTSSLPRADYEKPTISESASNIHSQPKETRKLVAEQLTKTVALNNDTPAPSQSPGATRPLASGVSSYKSNASTSSKAADQREESTEEEIEVIEVTEVVDDDEDALQDAIKSVDYQKTSLVDESLKYENVEDVDIGIDDEDEEDPPAQRLSQLDLRRSSSGARRSAPARVDESEQAALRDAAIRDAHRKETQWIQAARRERARRRLNRRSLRGAVTMLDNLSSSGNDTNSDGVDSESLLRSTVSEASALESVRLRDAERLRAAGKREIDERADAPGEAGTFVSHPVVAKTKSRAKVGSSASPPELLSPISPRSRGDGEKHHNRLADFSTSLSRSREPSIERHQEQPAKENNTDTINNTLSTDRDRAREEPTEREHFLHRNRRRERDYVRSGASASAGRRSTYSVRSDDASMMELVNSGPGDGTDGGGEASTEPDSMMSDGGRICSERSFGGVSGEGGDSLGARALGRTASASASAPISGSGSASASASTSAPISAPTTVAGTGSGSHGRSGHGHEQEKREGWTRWRARVEDVSGNKGDDGDRQRENVVSEREQQVGRDTNRNMNNNNRGRTGRDEGGGAGAEESKSSLGSGVSHQRLYELLRVRRDASEAQIKKSYYTLAREYHPDKNADDASATDKFQQLAEAYRVLSDPESRAIYDRYGDRGLVKNSVDMIDPSTLFAMVFGSEQFVALIGELQVASLAARVDENGNTPSEEVLGGLQRTRVGKLALEMIKTLKPWVDGDKKGFLRDVHRQMRKLREANFGPSLLHTVGNIYVQQTSYLLDKTKPFNLSAVMRKASLRSHKMAAHHKAVAAAARVMDKQRRLHDRVMRCGRDQRYIGEEEAKQIAVEMAENAIDMMWKMSVIDIETTLEDVLMIVLSGRDLVAASATNTTTTTTSTTSTTTGAPGAATGDAFKVSDASLDSVHALDRVRYRRRLGSHLGKDRRERDGSDRNDLGLVRPVPPLSHGDAAATRQEILSERAYGIQAMGRIFMSAASTR